MQSKKRNAMITGAAVGIGRATAIKFAEKGINLVLVDLDRAGLEATAKECLGVEVIIKALSVTDEKAINNLVTEVYEKLGNIDILVNNAAIWREYKDFLTLSAESWKKMLDVNIMGTVYPTRAVINKMLEQKWGRIINVASVSGVYGIANMTHYSATKGAVIAFTHALAKETTGSGVLVNAVSPGTVSPSDNLDISYTEPNAMSYSERTGSDEENANLIAFLASEEASYISGQNIINDGCRKKL